MNFEHYVAGRTIAVVGPAPLPHDQSADIDAHDLVYRPAQSPVGGWYGTRTDIAYLNGAMGRTILDDDQADVRSRIDHATWWVYKNRSAAFRPQGRQRIAHRPAHVINPNAVTGILWDLTHFAPASITVYGTDLYASGPGKAYAPEYQRRDPVPEANAYLAHMPLQQLRAHRAIHATGLIAGDQRYIDAVTMTDDEYQAVIALWQHALEPLT